MCGSRRVEALRCRHVRNAQVSVFSLSPKYFLCPVLGSISSQMCIHMLVCVLCHIILKIIHNRIKQTLEGEMCAGGGVGGGNIFVPSPLESFSRPVFTEAYRMCLMFPWQRKR